MKASTILAVAAVICLLSILAQTSLASHHHQHHQQENQHRQQQHQQGNQHHQQQQGNQHHQQQGNKHHENSPDTNTNTFDRSNLVRFSYSTECPKVHHNKHHGDKHQGEDKSLACHEEKYIFDRAQNLASRATKSSTKYSQISSNEFERIARAVSFYQGEVSEKPKEKGTDSVAKHEVKIYWNNQINELEIQITPPNRKGIFMDLGKTTESAKYSYHESQGNSDQDNLDKVIAEIVNSKEWIDIPTNSHQIECIKWIRMIAKTNEEIALVEKYLFYYDTKVKHAMFVENLNNFTLQSISSEPLMVEHGHHTSELMVHKTMQAAIDSNILFADSVYGHQDAGDRGIIVQINWKSPHSHKIKVKNVTIWDYLQAPENIKRFEFKMRVLKADVDYSEKEGQNAFELFTTNWWIILSYGFSAFLLVFGVMFVVSSVRRNRRAEDEYQLVDQKKQQQQQQMDTPMMFVKEDEQALIGEDAV